MTQFLNVDRKRALCYQDCSWCKGKLARARIGPFTYIACEVAGLAYRKARCRGLRFAQIVVSERKHDFSLARNLMRFAAIAATLAVAACDLSRSDAEQILEGVARGRACVANLQFVDGGFDAAKNSGAIAIIRNESGLLGSVYLVADLPGGDRWQVVFLGFEKNPNVSRKSQQNLCLPGKAEVTSIADAPFAPGSGSYKLVDFVEVVAIPLELERIKPYVYARYSKREVFQKTDAGWRVAQ